MNPSPPSSSPPTFPSQSPYIVVFNAPPRSGKDECAVILQEEHGFSVDRFSAPLKGSVCALFGLSLQQLEATKDTSSEILMGMTGREVQIWLSEKVMKPKFGEDIFGRLLGRRIARACHQAIPQRLFAIPDSGFVPELDGMLRELQFLQPTVIMVRVGRPGYTFEGYGDSRNYLDTLALKARNVEAHLLRNDGDLEDLHSKMRGLAYKWGWTPVPRQC